MKEKTYEVIIEALVADLEMERWRLKEAQKEIADLKKKENKDGKL